MSQLDTDQLEKFYRLSPKLRSGFISILKLRNRDPSSTPRHLEYLSRMKVDVLLKGGVFKFVADQETRNIVNDYFFITPHDHPIENSRRQSFNGSWPPDEDEMVLHNLSFRNYIYHSIQTDSLCLVRNRLDRVTGGGSTIYACSKDVYPDLSSAKEAKKTYSHHNSIDIFAISYYTEWTTAIVDGEPDDEIEINDIRELISPRHISKNVEAAKQNLLTVFDTVQKLFYGLFIKKSKVLEFDLLPKYINVNPRNLVLQPELFKDEPSICEKGKKDRLFVKRQSLRVSIDKNGVEHFGLYTKQKKFYKIIDRFSREFPELTQDPEFRESISFISFSNHLKIPILENKLLDNTLTKINSIANDNVIDRSRLLLSRVKSLPYFIGYDLPLLKMFSNSILTYLEKKSSSEFLCKMLNGLEDYFDLLDVKRIDSHSLNKCFSEFMEVLV